MLQNSNVDNWDAHWQELSNDIYFNTPAVKYRWRCIEKLLNLSATSLPSVNLIDFGCGTGNLLQYFSSRYKGIHLKGTDNSATGLEIARQKLPQAEFFKADLCAADAINAHSHDGWATHATCSEVLEHLDDPIEFLKNAGKFLSKGATLVISVPGGPMSSFDHRVGHRKHYTTQLLQAELQQAGYQVDKVVAAGFPFHNIYRLAFILRGESIMKDASRHEHGTSAWLTMIMTAFHYLFKFNCFNSRLGWTVLAKATWKG